MEKGAIELAPLPSLWYYSWLFVVMKASGSWRLVIDLSLLNLKIQKTSFKMETLQSVLLSVRAGDWMVSLDLKDAYLQVPMHLESRKFLRFVACGKIYQFKVLCFGLSTTPQVFTRVMAPVLAFLHQSGIRLRCYLDDWLIQASSREQVLLALESVLQLCLSLGIVVNWEKSQLIPSQRMVYLGVLLDSISFRASPTLKRVEKLLSIGNEFLSCERQPVSSWLELLGVLASLIQLIPGGRLRMRSLQFLLRRSWDQTDQSILVRWTPEIRGASDVGWGAHLGEDVASGLWSPDQLALSINARDLLAIERALSFFAPQIQDSSVAVFADNSTAIAYLRNQGGTRSQPLNAIAQRILRWAESLPVALAPQFIMGRHNVLADSLSRPNQILGSEWTLKTGISGPEEEVAGVHRPICHLTQSPMLSIFFTIPQSERLSYGCSAPELEWVAGVCLSSLVTHSGSPQGALVVLWSSDTHSSILAATALVPGSSGSGGGRSGGSASVPGPSLAASLSSASSGGVRAVASWLETIQRFAQVKGFSKYVAKQSALACRSFSRAGYQARWSILSAVVSWEWSFCFSPFTA